VCVLLGLLALVLLTSRVGHKCVYAPSMTVCMVVPLALVLLASRVGQNRIYAPNMTARMYVWCFPA
jgi:hypothetical protein